MSEPYSDRHPRPLLEQFERNIAAALPGIDYRVDPPSKVLPALDRFESHATATTVAWTRVIAEGLSVATRTETRFLRLGTKHVSANGQAYALPALVDVREHSVLLIYARGATTTADALLESLSLRIILDSQRPWSASFVASDEAQLSISRELERVLRVEGGSSNGRWDGCRTTARLPRVEDHRFWVAIGNSISAGVSETRAGKSARAHLIIAPLLERYHAASVRDVASLIGTHGASGHRFLGTTGDPEIAKSITSSSRALLRIDLPSAEELEREGVVLDRLPSAAIVQRAMRQPAISRIDPAPSSSVPLDEPVPASSAPEPSTAVRDATERPQEAGAAAAQHQTDAPPPGPTENRATAGRRIRLNRRNVPHWEVIIGLVMLLPIGLFILGMYLYTTSASAAVKETRSPDSLLAATRVHLDTLVIKQVPPAVPDRSVVVRTSQPITRKQAPFAPEFGKPRYEPTVILAPWRQEMRDLVQSGDSVRRQPAFDTARACLRTGHSVTCDAPARKY